MKLSTPLVPAALLLISRSTPAPVNTPHAISGEFGELLVAVLMTWKRSVPVTAAGRTASGDAPAGTARPTTVATAAPSIAVTAARLRPVLIPRSLAAACLIPCFMCPSLGPAPGPPRHPEAIKASPVVAPYGPRDF